MSAEKLTLAERKAVKAAIERARGTDKKGKSAQSSIPARVKVFCSTGIPSFPL